MKQDQKADHPTVLKATLLLLSMMTVMSGATIAPSLPGLRDHFADVEGVDFLVRLILTVPALLIAVAAPLIGIVLDRIGRKWPILLALLLYAAAGSSGLYLDSITAILIGRAVLGVAVAGIMTGTVTLIADLFQGESRSRFMGIQTGFMGLGGVVFLLVGGFLADLHWRAPFAVYFFALVLFPLAFATLRRVPSHRAGAAPGGFSRVTPTLIVTILMIYALAFFGFAVFYLIPTQLPFLLQEMGDISNTRVGLAIAWNSGVAALIALNFGSIRRRLTPAAIVALMLFLWGAGYLAVAVSNSYVAVMFSLMISGLGFGIMMPNLNVWLTHLAPSAYRGRIVSGITMSVFLGQFFSPLISQPLVNAGGLHFAFFAVAMSAWALAVVFLGVILHTRRPIRQHRG